jgi:long-chain fatty acid transport protein
MFCLNFCKARSIIASSGFFIVNVSGLHYAMASGLALHEQSAAAIAESYAGTATGAAGLSSMFWNPATLSQNQGLQVSASLSGILPYATQTTDVTRTGGALANPSKITNSGDVLGFEALPVGYVSYQIDNRVWVGLAVNSPFGLNSKNPENWMGSFYGITSEISTDNINPNIAVKVLDNLTVAAGLQVEHLHARLTNGFQPYVNSIKGNSWGAGFTLGATYYVLPQTVLGIGYRSRVYENMSGRETIPSLALMNKNISTNVVLPDSINAGLSQQINDKWQADLGFEYTRWSSFGSFPVTGGYPNQSLDFSYNNSWMASAGVQYRWDTAWTLKAGAGYETSPIDDVNRRTNVPDANRIWTSAGVNYRIADRLSVDAGYAHVFIGDGNVNITASSPALNYAGTTKAHADIFSLGVNYRWF